MPNTISSPNMSLPVPVVGVDPGPDYAINIDACFSLLDSHDHSLGKGVQITPSGLNINSDLNFGGNNAIALRSSRYTAQGSPIALAADKNCLSVSGVDLYYNDGNGNIIRITQSGSVVSGGGGFSGLVAPASANYNGGSGTFVLQSGINIPGNLDIASIKIREQVASPNAVTISSPTSLAANYTLVLPAALPGSTQVLQSDSSGNLSFFPLASATGSFVGPGGYSTIAAAIAATSAGGYITVSVGTYTENITLNKNLTIVGQGRGTVLNGTWTFASGSDDSLIRQIKFGGNVTVNSGVQELQVDDMWIGTGSSIIDNSGNFSNFFQGMQE